jgi:hypothetical protein
MNDPKKRLLEAAGYKSGTVDEFLGLTPEESALVELRVAIASRVRRLRVDGKLSQIDMARRMGSSQSRIAKLEAAQSEVSLDLLFRAFFAAGGEIDTGPRFHSPASRGSPKRAIAILQKAGAVFAKAK